MKSSSFNIVLFLLLAMLWSVSFINIKVAVEVFPPIFSALMRVFIAFLTLTFLFLVQRKSLSIPFKDSWRLWVTGLFHQGLPFALLFYGERFVAPALASIINSTVSIWALLLGTLIFGDRDQWTGSKAIGVLLGFGGVMFIFYPLLAMGNSTLIGMLSILGMAICYAIGALINQHFVFGKMKVSMEANLWHQHVASLLFLVILSFSLETWPAYTHFLNTKVLIALLYLGVCATALAWIIYFHLIKQWGAVGASSVMYIVPLLAILWDFLFLHLIPTWNEGAGAVAILLGVIMIQRVKLKK